MRYSISFRNYSVTGSKPAVLQYKKRAPTIAEALLVLHLLLLNSVNRDLLAVTAYTLELYFAVDLGKE